MNFQTVVTVTQNISIFLKRDPVIYYCSLEKLRWCTELEVADKLPEVHQYFQLQY